MMKERLYFKEYKSRLGPVLWPLPQLNLIIKNNEFSRLFPRGTDSELEFMVNII